MKVFGALSIRLLTHNIRYATTSPFKGEEKWSVRKSRLINELSFNTAHCAESFICLQEVLHQQLVDILAGLNGKEKAWAFVGVGRDDGLEAGEYSPICMFFSASIFPLLGQRWSFGTCLENLCTQHLGSRLDVSPRTGNTDSGIGMQCTNLKFGYVNSHGNPSHYGPCSELQNIFQQRMPLESPTDCPIS